MADDQKFISDLQSSSADVRFDAWRAAGDVSPAVIPQVGKLASSPTPGIAKAAREALTTMTHAVGKDPDAPKRAGVASPAARQAAKRTSALPLWRSLMNF